MRKIEVAVPSGKGEIISKISMQIGALDSYIIRAHGPGADKDIVTITCSEEHVDKVVEGISGYAEEKKVKFDIRIWKTEKPFSEIEQKGEEEETKVPFEELKANIFESSNINLTFMILVILSAALAALGLLQNSAIVIIGAMIIAPLLRPIMASALGTVVGDLLMFLRGTAATLFGLILAVVIVFIIAIFIPGTHLTPLVLQISTLSLITIAVALIAGMIAAISMVSQLSENLAGVSIAVALMPPAAALGLTAFSFVTGSTELTGFLSALLVVIINVISIDVGGAIVFYLSGIRPVGNKKQQEEGQKFFQTHLKIAFLLIALLSIPFVVTAWTALQQENIESEITTMSKELARSVNAEIIDLSVTHNPLEVKLIMVSKLGQPALGDFFQQRLKKEFGANAKVFLIKTE